MNGYQNQAPTSIGELEPGVRRRVATLVDRGDADHRVPGTGITMEEFHQYQLLGRRLQAQAVASAFASLGSAFARPLKALVHSLAEARRAGQAARQLRAMDDHLLADIGIARDQIPAAVAGLVTRSEVDAHVPAPTPLRPRAAATAIPDTRRAA